MILHFRAYNDLSARGKEGEMRKKIKNENDVCRIEVRICALFADVREVTDRPLFQSNFSFLAPFSYNSAQLFHSFFLTFCLFPTFARSL